MVASKFAHSLATLQELQSGARRIFKSTDLGRAHRERLVQRGFLRGVIRGWLMSSDPHAEQGDPTLWYASFWEFCARYCLDRFGDGWFVSPEQSLLIHAEVKAIPARLIVHSPKGTNNKRDLLFGTSIYDRKIGEMPPAEDLAEKSGLRVYTPNVALVKVPEGFFRHSPVEAQVVLASVRDASGILGKLLDGGHSVVAGRIAGAFRRIGRGAFADEIMRAMKGAGYNVQENDPFGEQRRVPTIIGNPAAQR